MKNIFRILTINPGSTSTKIGVFDNEELILEKTLRHSSEEIGKYEKENKCQTCSSGKYCPGDAESYDCPSNTYSAAGASSCSPCGCIIGTCKKSDETSRFGTYKAGYCDLQREGNTPTYRLKVREK